MNLLSKRSLPEYKAALKITLEEADRMLKTIEDLLYLARLDYQPGLLKFKKINLNEFLTEIYHQTKILSAVKRIKVNILMSAQNVFIQADSLHLRRLFLNLIDNALKFSPEDGRINFLVACDDHNVTISISDTGPGIPPAILSRIFEKFYRGDERVFGNGLGLSIVQSIAKAHLGQVEVESQLNHGTIFHITLPRQ